jgi:tRNA pseudouridine13 synthase
VEVLRVDRHDHRLRAGQLAGNRFRLVVREVDAEQAETATEHFRRISEQGLPNRFGRQRYGRDGRNAERGMAILRGESFRGSRQQAWLMINAAQSRVFDTVLDRRPIDRLLKGDLAVVHATGEWLWVEDPERFRPRLEAFELSPTGPLVGTKVRRPRGEVAALEKAVAEELGLPELDGLRLPYKLRVSGDRRALRIRPGGMERAWEEGEDDDGGVLRLSFDLPPGAYATVLLEELFPGGFEEGPVLVSERTPA